VSGMRKKRKARGRAERAALEAVAAQAGVEVEPEGHDQAEEAEGAGDEPAGVARDASGGSAGGDPGEDGEGQPGDGDGDGEGEGEGEGAGGAEGGEESGVVRAADLDDDRFTSLIEALLFASDKPLTVARLRQLTRVSDTARIQAALERVAAEHAERGIVLSSVSGGYSFRTHSTYSPWVQQLIQGRPVRLSRAQLETLAIIAYRQPITRPEIDQIRGVDSGATLRLLLDRSLIRVLGKREEVGRPLLYGTTKDFLDFFSLNDLRELPTLREYSELTDESRNVVEQMGLNLAGVARAAAAAADPTDTDPSPDASADTSAAADASSPTDPDIPDTEPAESADGTGP